MTDFPDYKTVSVNSLVPYARNSRTHSDEQVAQIAASIKEFGFLNPIIMDGENGIIAGHGRVLAAQKLGLEPLPCVGASHLTDAQRKAYVIVRRWQDFTGKQATLEATGETFEEVSDGREAPDQAAS